MGKKQDTSQTSSFPYKGVLIAFIVGVIFLFIIVPIFFVLAVSVLSSGSDTSGVSGSGNVAFIRIEGTIVSRSSAPSLFGSAQTTSADQIKSYIEQIQRNNRIEGVIFEINSPGGSGVAADEIARLISELDKPTVSYIREVGTSAAYWIASSTDTIYANRLSTVGSIGVLSGFLDFSQFIQQYNISYNRFVAGENKDFGSPFLAPTDEQSEHFQSLLNSLYDVFLLEVATLRNVSIDQLQPLADGSIYSGVRAKELGLIDGFGSQQEAIVHMEGVLGKSITLVPYTRQTTFFESFFGFMSQGFYAMGKGIGSSVTFFPLSQNQIITY